MNLMQHRWSRRARAAALNFSQHIFHSLQYRNRNDRTSCVCGAARQRIPDHLWRVTDKHADLIYPKYFYRCQHCQSFSAVNLYFPIEMYQAMSLEAMFIDDLKKRLNATRVDWIARHATQPANALVLDLGAGEGCFSHTYAAAHGAAKVLAVEADARVKDVFYGANDRVEFVAMYIEDFLREFVIDNRRRANLVVLTDVLEHVLSPEALLKAVAGVLAPGGVAYLTVPDAATFEPPFPFPEAGRKVDWAHANRTCQHLWMMMPETFRRIVADHFEIVAETRSLETDIRRDSSYTTILARKPG